ncbi:3'-5' exonuclease [Sporosarcina sp. ACRSM]|uniref:3'-5' exonuclease n=1 Tax=Sporosarcina sp. ACRSM TaxID=2918216 RepID=UPI001EF4150A|nr:exonuclease domain-containing protein [Sporosarcina sp. ACRSM]MCG7335894.1 3'-5' exonuclease [Sporosarcina sp. ACRSM]
MFGKKKRLNIQLDYAIRLDTRIQDMAFTVIDTETTGFAIGAKDGLIEIGAVHIEQLEVTDSTFQTFVNPARSIPHHITNLTSIEQVHIDYAPSSLEAIGQLFEFMGTCQSVSWIGHHISFDQLVLKKELARANYTYKEPLSFDTMDLIRYLYPTSDQLDLDEYARLFGTKRFQRHRALGDALSTAHLFVELVKRLEKKNITTISDLMRIKNGSVNKAIFI